MELIINLVFAGFTLFVAIYVEKIMYHFPLTKKEVDEYQAMLDKAGAKYSLPTKYDAFTELMTQRKQAKGFTLIFSGILAAIALIALAFVTNLSLLNIGIICASALILIIYGIIQMAESKKLAIVMLTFVLALGTMGRFALDELIALSPYAYFYLCGLVLLLGVFVLGRSSVKSKQPKKL
ncbi:MAG: hypothetical protein WCT50_04470 [Patescibacteria group bacterium]